MSYTMNFENAYVCLVANAGTHFGAGVLPKLDCKVIGIAKKESGYELKKEEVDQDSAGEEIVISHRAEVSIDVITKLTSAIEALDDTKMGVLFLESAGVTIPSTAATLNDTGVVIPDGNKALLLNEMPVHFKELKNFGTGKVQPITIEGYRIAQSKDDLRAYMDFDMADGEYDRVIYDGSAYA